MGDLIDMRTRAGLLPLIAQDITEILVPSVTFDTAQQAQLAAAASRVGPPFCAIVAPPSGGVGWMLDRYQARELAIALLQWSQAAEDTEEPDAG